MNGYKESLKIIAVALGAAAVGMFLVFPSELAAKLFLLVAATVFVGFIVVATINAADIWSKRKAQTRVEPDLRSRRQN